MTINLDDIIPEGMKLGSDAAPQKDWSSFQTNFFHEVETTSDNLVLEAVAGSGKTTTILEAMRRLGSQNVLFLAFNKAIQQELAARVPMGVTTKTLNGLGHGVLSPHTETRQLNTYKAANTLKQMLREEIYRDYGYDLSRLLGSARSHGIGIRTDLSLATWREFLLGSEMYVDANSVDQFSEILRRAFNTMLDEYRVNFDFDDQLYLPIFHNWTFPKFDTVFVDEAQDLSFINHCQLSALAKRGARIIAVGDSHQAIYGFRGADKKSMGNLAERFSARILPLSICYRCGKDIVTRAQRLVPHILYADSSPLGAIIDHGETPEPFAFPERSMIICRNNAPLFTLGLAFLRARVRCQLVSDFPQQLYKLIDKMGASKCSDLKAKLVVWCEAEIAKLEALHRDHLIDNVRDKVESLLPFCDEYTYTMQLKQAIKELCESSVGPRLSSVHKAKGLESDDVFILRPDLMPAARALDRLQQTGDDSALIQEENLEYVAITRAKLRLHYLPRGR